MNRFWTAKIETKVAKNKNLNEKEKKLFQIKIRGINHQSSPFKIKTQRNDELFSKEFIDNLKLTINLDDSIDQYLNCAYHGRNKRISLYVIGCDYYTGLLILDENLYSLIPITTTTDQQQSTYRIDLISPTIKYNTTSIGNTSIESTKSTDNNNNNNSLQFNSIDIILNLDKRYLNQQLQTQSNETKLNYFQNLILKSHLTWSYYYYEHGLRLKFKNIFFDYFTDADYLPTKQLTNKKTKLFNLNPIDLLKNNTNNNKFNFKDLFNDLSLKYNKLPAVKNEINAYLLPDTYLNNNNNNWYGIASQSSLIDCKQSSLILIKDKYVLNETIANNKFPIFKLALEEANILIDLIGFNLGNRHVVAKKDCNLQSSDEYNWYFQVHSIDSNSGEQQQQSDLDPTDPTESSQANNNNLCLNRLIRINTNDLINCNTTTTPTTNYISVVKEPTCGNGIIEANEQCDCGINDLPQCSNCCNMKTCRFQRFDYQCANGDCCDLNQCKFKSKTTICRQAAIATNNNSTECDWPEYCTGDSGKCPENKYHHNGLECNNNKDGTCWNGVCVSASQECKTLWSEQASNSDSICYKKFNTIGFENGNCGVEQQKQFKACDLIDAECGLLQCQSGTEQPLIKTESYFKVTTKLKEQNFECKSITQPSIYVSDGTQCNERKGVCIQQKCTHLNKILKLNEENKCFNTKTKQLCSNQGICSNFEECQCFENWTGKFCETKQTQKFIVANAQLDMKLNLKTTSLMAIAAGVSIIFLILIFIGFIFFRRIRTKSRNSQLLKQKQNQFMKKSLSRSLIEFDNDYTVNNNNSEKLNPKKTKSIFSSFNKKKKNELNSTSTRVNSMNSLTDNFNSSTNNNNNSNSNDCSISFTKVNQAIQQLNSQPVKSILKKDNINQSDGLLLKNATSGSLNQIDSSFKFERQVNRNTLLNAAIGNGHRTSRRSLVFENKTNRASICSLTASSSSSSSISLSSCSSQSISSSLSKTKHDTVDFANIKPSNNNNNNTSFISNASPNSISSVVIQEPTPAAATDFLKVQDYLNELNILSKQNTFAAASSNDNNTNDSNKRNSKEISESPIKPISLLFNNNNNNNTSTKLTVSETPQRPVSLLTTVFAAAKQETTLPSNQMLHLHITTAAQKMNNDETSNLFTNSSETSSGYLSNSTTNLNQLNNKSNNNNNSKFLKLSKESLFETDEYYSITTTATKVNNNNKQHKIDSNESSNTSSSSSVLTTPNTIVTTKIYLSPNKQQPQRNNLSNGVDKRFSYIIATASSNNLNVS